jgi:hypothetical protein
VNYRVAREGAYHLVLGKFIGHAIHFGMKVLTGAIWVKSASNQGLAFLPPATIMSARTPSLYSQDDPLSNAIRPPTTETDLEKKARLQREAEARRISEQIDEDIRQERERIKKSKEDVKVSLSLLRNDSIYPQLRHPIAPATRAGRVREIDFAETI